MHALEGVADRLLAGGQYLGALKSGLAAVAIEPIREPAHQLVIEVHLAEDNPASPLVNYQRYRTLFQRELGVTPSARMAKLANGLPPA